MKKIIQRSIDRGVSELGWLSARFSFSFSDYYNPLRMGFGSLRVLNNDIISPVSGFGTHSHSNMEIITIPLRGELEHRDSLGPGGVIKEGEVQVMSAGTGILHSEKNPSSSEELELFQIWIEPDKLGVVPRYEQKRFELVKNKLNLVVSGGEGAEKGLFIYSDSRIFLGEFEKGTSEKLEIGEGRGIFLMVVEGKVEVDGGVLEKRDSIEVSDIDNVGVRVIEDCKVLVIDVEV